jgi:diguanylate cyclase (GGDEF)-like protein
MRARPVSVKHSSSGTDISFSLARTLDVERTIWNLRWVALVVGPALAWLAGSVAIHGLLLAVAAAGALVNLVQGYLLRRHPGLLAWLGYATALLDVALISGFAAALEGPASRYAHLYLLSVAAAAMRFGFVGTVVMTAVAWGGLASVFWLTYGVPDNLSSQVAHPTLLLLLAGLLLGWFARQVKEWLKEGVRREQDLERRLTELTVLQEVNRAVYDLKSGDTLQNIVQVCTKVLGFRRAALFLHTEHEDMPDRYYSSRQLGRSEELPLLHFDLSLFETMLKADRPFVVNGSQGSDMMVYGRQLEIAAPLTTPSGPIGVLVVDCDDRERVSETSIELLSALAKAATLAIENARVHNQAQWRASHDGLTNLYNHGHFQEALRKKVARSKSEGQSLALLMIEVDGFKQYNDTHGHRQGDIVLVTLARALETWAEQQQGIAARYGGDEFVVILPGLDRPAAFEAAQTLRTWVSGLTSRELRRHGLPGITLSFGVAVYPADAQDAARLIDAADRAMYSAKRQGGDQVMTFSEVGASSTSPLRPLATAREQEIKP